MRLCIHLLSIVTTIACGSVALQGQTTVIIRDDFETGQVNAAVWNEAEHLDSSNGVIAVAASPYHYVLQFVSDADHVRRVGAYYSLPMFASDDVLVAQVDVRMNAANTWFTFEPGTKRSTLHSGGTGTRIASTVWGLPCVYNSPANSGDDTLPAGLKLQVPYDSLSTYHYYSYLISGWPSVGQWHRFRTVYGTSSQTVEVDGQVALTLSGPQVVYRFAQADDWVFLLGDGGSHSYCTTNAFFDNVLLMRTKRIILDIADAFPNDVPIEDTATVSVLDGYYNQFGAQTLQAALDASGGDYQEFLDYLTPKGSITVITAVDGTAPTDVWSYAGDLGQFVLPAGGGTRTFSDLTPGTYEITQRAKSGYACSSTSTGGESGIGSITVTLDAGENLRIAFANTHLDERIAVIAVQYADTVNPAYNIAQLKERADRVRRYYEDQSYGTCRIFMDFIFGDSYGRLTTDFDHYDWNGDGVLNGEDDSHGLWANVFSIADDAEALAVLERGFDASEYSAILVIQPGCIRSAALEHRAVSGIDDSYATWAHELGHAHRELEFADYYFDCPRDTGGNVGYWCLMGAGNLMNEAGPIMAYNKVVAGWLQWQEPWPLAADLGTYDVPLLSHMTSGDAVLRLKLDETLTLVFEGRLYPDGVPLDVENLGGLSCSCSDYSSVELTKPGVEVYLTEQKYEHATNVYSIPNLKYSPGSETHIPSSEDYEYDPNRVTLEPSVGSIVDLVRDIRISAAQAGDGYTVTVSRNETTSMVVVDIGQIETEGVHCPALGAAGDTSGLFDVDLHIYDAEGHHVGMNYATGEYEVGIPGAVTWGNIPGGGPEWIGIPAGIGFYAVADATPAREWADLNPGVDPSDLQISANVTVIHYSSDGQRTVTSEGTHQLDVFRTTPLCAVGIAHALGDVNGDGVINLVDVRLCLGIATSSSTGSAEERAAADVNVDGDVDLTDVRILAEYVDGERSTLP